ncbi:MAG: hypothetical protein R3E12_00355 [Candidatus Eisenbacteria bacterium]
MVESAREPTHRRPSGKWLRPLLTLWLALFAASFYLPRLIEAEGTGFTRGSNRIPVMIALHGAALVIALLCTANGLRAKRAGTRGAWMGFVPLGVELVLLFVLVAVVLNARAS